MAVYVDSLMNYGGSATFRWKDSCHMFADSIDELNAFALKIGMKLEWFQQRTYKDGRKGLPHYDLNKTKRTKALKHGAVEMNLHDAVEKWADLGWSPHKESRQRRQELEQKRLVVQAEYEQPTKLPADWLTRRLAMR